MLKEWPLVAFTIAGQTAVGVFLLAGVPLFFSGEIPSRATPRPGLDILVIVFVLLALAIFVSLFHLHHPFRARYALSNILTSWLSREIFFELGFMALVGLALVLGWRPPAEERLLKGILAAAGLAGILFILSMSKLYMLRTVPPWDRASTPISFILTTLSLGALAAALVMGPGARKPLPAGAFVLLSFVFVAVGAAAAFLVAPGYGVFGYRPAPSLRPPARAHRTLHLARLTLLLSGLAFIRAAMAAGEGRASSGPGGNGLLTAALVLVLGGEVAGRFLFYGLFSRPGR